MSRDAMRAERTDYELVDAVDGRRLERFGARVVDRPAPAARHRRLAPDAWAAADLGFEPDHGWAGADATWTIDVAGLTIELRPTSSGGLGFYPEHTANVEWLVAEVQSRAKD